MAFFVFAGFRTKRQRVFNRFIKRPFRIAVWNTPTFEPCLLSENANWADAKARENLKIVYCAFIRTTDVLTTRRDFFVKSVLIIRFYKRKKKTSRSKTIQQYLSLPPSTKISTHRRQRDVDSNYYEKKSIFTSEFLIFKQIAYLMYLLYTCCLYERFYPSLFFILFGFLPRVSYTFVLATTHAIVDSNIVFDRSITRTRTGRNARA